MEKKIQGIAKFIPQNHTFPSSTAMITYKQKYINCYFVAVN